MSNIALQVEGLGKKYRIGERREAYKTLRDGLATAIDRSLNRLRHSFDKGGSTSSSRPTDYWALRDVSFDVKYGEVVGIVGKNGAGKSTLLKLLSRITEPTEGRAKVFGRVGSLLEVGTGFHPELTGRENVYMNGAILGMTRLEIDRKFDEIVAFAEVETFLDTPVKRYSSGMQLRLGFAVAAHLEPDILIVDEVLAVGDIAFQKKCLGKMGDVSRAGRTVLFVSHNLSAIAQLSSSALLLDGGRALNYASTEVIVEQYLHLSSPDGGEDYDLDLARSGFPNLTREIEFVGVRVLENRAGGFASGDDIRIRLRIFGNDDIDRFRLSFTLFRADGAPVGSGFGHEVHSIVAGESQELELRISKHGLASGRYYFGLGVGVGSHLASRHRDFDIIMNVCRFQVLPQSGDQNTLSHWPSAWGAICFQGVTTNDVQFFAEPAVREL